MQVDEQMQVDEKKLQKQFDSCMKRIPMRAMFMMKMPMAAVAGLRIDHVSSEQTIVTVPGGWRTQNPFGTMYWAVQGMAAELATGIVPNCLARSMPMKLRMFVVGTEATFGRKAYGRCTFTCTDTHKVMDAIQQSLDTGESVNCDLTAVGTDGEGETISDWVFRWNFLATQES